MIVKVLLNLSVRWVIIYEFINFLVFLFMSTDSTVVIEHANQLTSNCRLLCLVTRKLFFRLPCIFATTDNVHINIGWNGSWWLSVFYRLVNFVSRIKLSTIHRSTCANSLALLCAVTFYWLYSCTSRLFWNYRIIFVRGGAVLLWKKFLNAELECFRQFA